MQATLDAAFARIAPIVGAHGGTVEEFIGDAVMAVFGVPAACDGCDLILNELEQVRATPSRAGPLREAAPSGYFTP